MPEQIRQEAQAPSPDQLSSGTDMPKAPGGALEAQNADHEKKKDVLAEHILRAAGLSGDDLAAFQHVFRDAVTQLRNRLAPYTPTKLWVDLRQLETLKTSDFEEIFKSTGLVAIFSAPRWGGDVIFVLDENLVNLIVDAFFGAQIPSNENRLGRILSPVEKKSAEAFARTMASAMDDIFGSGDGSLFEMKSILPISQFDRDDFAQMRMFSCSFEVGYGETSTSLCLLMPRSCHRPIQEAVTRVLRAPSTRTDPMWAHRLRHEVSRAHVTIEAYNIQGTMTLKQLSQLKAGQILPLPADVMDGVRLRSGNKPLYKCSLGKIGQNFSARVHDVFDEEEEMIDGLVSG